MESTPADARQLIYQVGVTGALRGAAIPLHPVPSRPGWSWDIREPQDIAGLSAMNPRYRPRGIPVIRRKMLQCRPASPGIL